MTNINRRNDLKLSRQVRVSAATTEVGEDGFDDFGRRIGIKA
jgi:hypothetical protein